MLVLGYVEHNLALLVLPVVIAGLAIAGTGLLRRPKVALARIWSRGANAGVNLPQALNIWIIQIVVAVGPPLGGLILSVYMKTDWGISLFFLTPLALVAIPQLRLPGVALFRIVGDLAGAHARHARRLAHHRATRHHRQSQCGLQLRRTLAAGARADEACGTTVSFRAGPWSPVRPRSASP